MKNRRDDKNLDRDGCFAWLHHWKTAPTHTVAGLEELYQQLLHTKVYYHSNTGLSGNADEGCRMCGKTSENVGHILAGCSAIGQTRYLARHNKALKTLFFEMLRSLNQSQRRSRNQLLQVLSTLPARLKFQRTREQYFYRSHFELYIVVVFYQDYT